MCKYCHTNMNNEKIFKNESSSIDIKRQPFFDEEMYALYVQLLDYDASFVVRINNCPMCGRKLGE